MKFVWAPLALVAVMSMAAGTAQAQSAAAVAQSQSGLYLRAEGGWSWAGDAQIKDGTSGIIGFNVPGRLDNIGSSPTFGGGVGYRFDKMFRADVTLNYRGGFSLDDQDDVPSLYRADIASWAAMLNGYIDLPVNVGRARPYIGGGIGWARNTIETIVNTDPGLGIFTVPGGTVNNPAWQIMAGLGFQIRRNLFIDLGYRYFDGGEIKSAPGALLSNGVPFDQYDGAEGRLVAHEAIIAVRFNL